MRRFVIGLVAGCIAIGLLIANKYIGLALLAFVFSVAIREILELTKPLIPKKTRTELVVLTTSGFILFSVNLAVEWTCMQSYLIQTQQVSTDFTDPSKLLFNLTVLPNEFLGKTLAFLMFIWLSVFLLVAIKIISCYPDGEFNVDSGPVVITYFSLLFMGLASFSLIYTFAKAEMWFIVCLLSWCSDAGALFVGKTIGRKKLCPRVSPRKTVEGLIGGMISAALAVAVFLYITSRTDSGNSSIITIPAIAICSILAFIIAGMAHVGDLFMSVVKRTQQVKESGTFIPEHGGAIDKIDSFTVVSITVLFLLAIANQG